jgi:hypothetical protein
LIEIKLINLFLNLETIGFPEHYSVEFAAFYSGPKNNGEDYGIQDFSDYVSIPPPKFTISTEPKTVLIRPNEEKQVQLQINGTSTLASSISLKSLEEDKGIGLTLHPNKISVASSGFSQSLIKIKVEGNLPSQTYVIPLCINFFSI